MNISLFRFLLLSVLSISTTVQAASNYMKSQYAGQLGFLSAGIGRDFNDTISLDLFFGVVPANISGETIKTVAIKNEYNIINFEFPHGVLTPYLGLSIFHALGKKYQTSNDDKYPAGYYNEASIRQLYYIGIDYKKITSTKDSVYFEMGMNDIWINNYAYNPQAVNAGDHVSLALGWKHLFF